MRQESTERNLGWKVKIFDWGSFALDGGAMFGIIPKTLWSKVAPPDASNRIPLALRSLYLERGDAKVLVDLGMGIDWDEKLAKIYDLKTSPVEEILQKNLGVAAKDITHVVLTHLHFDHCGFLSSKRGGGERKSNFENAEIFLSAENFRYAQRPHARESASYRPDIWSAPLARGQFTLIDCEWLEFRSVLPGIYLRRIDGHTRGQTLVYVDGTDKDYLFLADLCPTENHVKDLWTMGFDVTPATSIAEKQRILTEHETYSRELILEHSSTQATLRLHPPA